MKCTFTCQSATLPFSLCHAMACSLTDWLTTSMLGNTTTCHNCTYTTRNCTQVASMYTNTHSLAQALPVSMPSPYTLSADQLCYCPSTLHCRHYLVILVYVLYLMGCAAQFKAIHIYQQNAQMKKEGALY